MKKADAMIHCEEQSPRKRGRPKGANDSPPRPRIPRTPRPLIRKRVRAMTRVLRHILILLKSQRLGRQAKG